MARAPSVTELLAKRKKPESFADKLKKSPGMTDEAVKDEEDKNNRAPDPGKADSKKAAARGGKAKPTSKNKSGYVHRPDRGDEYGRVPKGYGPYDGEKRLPPGWKPGDPDPVDEPYDIPAKKGNPDDPFGSRKIPARGKGRKLPKTGLATYGSQVR